MDSTKPTDNPSLQDPKYIEFPALPSDAKHADGTLALNRHSTHITRGHDFPGAKVCLGYRACGFHGLTGMHS